MLSRLDVWAASAAPDSSPAPSGFIVERPPEGWARGNHPAPPWAIALLGATLVLSALIFFLFRLRKPRS